MLLCRVQDDAPLFAQNGFDHCDGYRPHGGGAFYDPSLVREMARDRPIQLGRLAGVTKHR